MPQKEQGTEQKIKESARKIFHEKGFSATKTRDIAEDAEINLALLNYYFRSKKKLFEIIMVETLQSFFGGLIEVLDNRETTIHEKVSDFVNHYMDLLSANPEVVGFILNAVRENPEALIGKIGMFDRMKDSHFVQQFKEGVAKGDIPALNPIHFMLNLMGLVIFPFIVQPMVSTVTDMPKADFLEMIQERRKLIPLWVESMLVVN